MIEKPFLETRLELAQKEWRKAEKKYHRRFKGCKPDSEMDSLLIQSAATRMAFLNGQRQLLKELINLENQTLNRRLSSNEVEKHE
jgi:hypothetical protein